MAAQELDLKWELDALKADMTSMIDQLSALSERFATTASEKAASLPARLQQAVTATAQEAEALGKCASDAAQDIEKYGKTSVDALRGYIQWYPVAGILIAFGFGVLIGKVLDRR